MIQQVANKNQRRLNVLAASQNGEGELTWNEDHLLRESYRSLPTV